MNIVKRVQAAYQAFKGLDWNQGDWVNSDAPGNISSRGGTRTTYIPGTKINWASVAGDLWNVPAAQACINAMWDNFPQAPPMIYRRNAKGEWQPDEKHPLLAILNRPNESHDGSIMFNGIILSTEADGNGYIVMERTRGQQIGELQYVPHSSVSPITRSVDVPPGHVEFYDVWLNGRHSFIEPKDMIHIKYGIDPDDIRLGMSPTKSCSRGNYTLQQGANYGANILRNWGNHGVYISRKQGDTMDLDPDAMLAQYKANHGGDNVGGAFISETALDIVFPGASPQSMALDTMLDRPESDVCALMRVPPQVAGVHVGRLSKTYANMKEAREAFWEEKLMPMGNMIGSQMGYKLLPEYIESKDPNVIREEMSNIRIGFDYTNVRPLQPDLDALHERAREDWKVNLLTLGEYCAMVKRPAPPAELADKRYMDLGGAKVSPFDGPAGHGPLGPNSNTQPKKSFTFPTWSSRIEAELAELEELHATSEGAPVLNGNGKH